MEEAHSAALHRRGHEAFSAGDQATLSELIADDAVYRIPGSNVLSGVHKGKAAVFACWAKLGELSGGTFKVSDHTFFLGDEVHSVTDFRATASRDGKALDVRLCEVVRWGQDKAVEIRILTSDEKAFDEFWG